MLKTITLFSCLLLFVSCSKTKEIKENSTSSPYDERDKVIPVDYDDSLNDYNKANSATVVDTVNVEELEKNRCFKSDNDVLEFYKGKTFSRITINLEDYWTFYSDKVIRTCWQKQKYRGDHINDEPRYQYWDYREIIYSYVSYHSSLDGTEGIVEYSDIPNDDRPSSDKFNCKKNYLHSGSGLVYQLGVLGEYPGDGIH